MCLHIPYAQISHAISHCAHICRVIDDRHRTGAIDCFCPRKHSICCHFTAIETADLPGIGCRIDCMLCCHILKITSYPSFLCNGYFPINSVFHKIVFHQDPIVPGKVQLVIHNNRSPPVIAARLFLIAVFPLQFAGTCIQTIKGSLCAVYGYFRCAGIHISVIYSNIRKRLSAKGFADPQGLHCVYIYTLHRSTRQWDPQSIFLSAHIAHRVHCCRKCHLTFYISVKIKFI